MSLLNFFKKEPKPTNFFSFPRNEEGIQKVIEWLKHSSGVVVDLDATNGLTVSITQQGEQFLTVYTDPLQRLPRYKQAERFATIDYKELVALFEANSAIDYIWINPNTDSIQLNRSVFTSQYTIKKNTMVQIGQPATPPTAIIDFLVSYAQTELSIEAIYLALMKNDTEFSYVVFIDSLENEKIVKKIGPEITECCLKNKCEYPVDFFYDDMIKDSKYGIYSKE